MSLQYWSHKWNTAEPVDPDCSQYMASQWLYSLPLLSLDCNLMNCPCFCPANQLCGVWSCGGRRQNFFTPRPVSCHTHPPLSQQLSQTIFLFSIMTKTNTQPSLHPSLPFSLLKKQQHTPLQDKVQKVFNKYWGSCIRWMFYTWMHHNISHLPVSHKHTMSQSAESYLLKQTTVCKMFSRAAHPDEATPSGSASGRLKSVPELKPTCRPKVTGATAHSSNMPRLVRSRVWGLWTAQSRV